MLTCHNRRQHLKSVLKLVDVDTDRQEMEMDILKGLPEQYENIITALDAPGIDIKSFTLELVKSQLLQEEPQRDIGHPNDCSTSSAVAFFGSSRMYNSSGTGPCKMR